MKKNRKFKILAIFLALVMMLPISVYAATDDNLMDALEDRKASLKLNCEYTDEDDTTLIDGVSFEIYQVASVSVKDNVATYTSLDTYESLGYDYEGMTASESNTYAKELADYVEENSIDGIAATSDAKGIASFSDLDLGIYLVRQVGSSGTAEDFSEYEPFLVLVPGIGEDGHWIYDMVATPKPLLTENEKPVTPETPKTPTPTGDTTQIYFWMRILGGSVAGMCLVILLISKRRKKEDY